MKYLNSGKKSITERTDNGQYKLDSLSSMQSFKFNRENHSILNQIYDMLAELKIQGEHITLWRVLAHMKIKGNKAPAKDMSEVATLRQPYTDYFLE